MNLSARNLDKRERDAQIRARAKTRTPSQLAEEFGLSRPRIHQILAGREATTDDQVAELEERLQTELAELVLHHERNRRRIAVIRRSLDRIAEEREAQEIDRLLGLA